MSDSVDAAIEAPEVLEAAGEAFDLADAEGGTFNECVLAVIRAAVPAIREALVQQIDARHADLAALRASVVALADAHETHRTVIHADELRALVSGMGPGNEKEGE